jgi:hypothetical protein
MTENPAPKYKPILHFWLIHKSSGITIFSQQFQSFSNEVDSDLVGGFIVAILGFAKEIAQQNIDYMQMSDLRLQYCIQNDFIMAVLTSNQVEISRIQLLLEHVYKKFCDKYGNMTNLNMLCDVRPFQSFAKITEEIFETETKYLTIIRSRAGSVEEYFKQASKEWVQLNETILHKSSAINKWGDANFMKINKEIQRDLIQARQISARTIMEAKKVRKNCAWVKP